MSHQSFYTKSFSPIFFQRPKRFYWSKIFRNFFWWVGGSRRAPHSHRFTTDGRFKEEERRGGREGGWGKWKSERGNCFWGEGKARKTKEPSAKLEIPFNFFPLSLPLTAFFNPLLAFLSLSLSLSHSLSLRHSRHTEQTLVWFIIGERKRRNGSHTRTIWFCAHTPYLTL